MTLGDLSIEWSTIFAILALMGGFLVGQAMDAVMGRQGFGALGNMIVLAAGFYLGLMAYEATRMPMDATEIRFAAGIASGFGSLFFLAVVKRILMRMDF
jgi:hypothetical protein